MASGKIEITAHNHNFAVDPDSLRQSEVDLTHIDLNDGTLEGLRHRSLPLFSVQYHPEAAPGPHDSHYLFKDFVKMMEEWAGADASLLNFKVVTQTEVSCYRTNMPRRNDIAESPHPRLGAHRYYASRSEFDYSGARGLQGAQVRRLVKLCWSTRIRPPS